MFACIRVLCHVCIGIKGLCTTQRAQFIWGCFGINLFSGWCNILNMCKGDEIPDTSLGILLLCYNMKDKN